MRISDWSSDVCSSDLDPPFLAAPRPWEFLYRRAADRFSAETQEMLASLLIELEPALVDDLEQHTGADEREDMDPAMRLDDLRRSEEHTSELQSLMRISYAVFCLKKKTHQTTTV